MSSSLSLPGFENLEPLGQGGTATVWKARQTRLRRTVAIKILRHKLGSSPDDLERFLREARTAAAIIHPNLVQVIDAGEHEGMIYTVMEYVPGSTIADLLDIRKRFDEADALSVACDLASALDHCWRNHRMIHSDIKPDNILVHTNGTIKLADMGLARLDSMDHPPVEDGITLGTPNFMSPEQATHGQAVDCRSDIYSLGATLYQMLTGVLPFGDLPPEQAMRAQLSGHLEDPWVLNPAISPHCAFMLEKWMARDPAHRPADWAAALADLEAVRAGLPPLEPWPISNAGVIRRARTRPLPPGVRRKQRQVVSALTPSPTDIHRRMELRSTLMQAAALGLLVLLAYGYSGAVTLPRSIRSSALPGVDLSFLDSPSDPSASVHSPSPSPPSHPSPPVLSRPPPAPVAPVASHWDDSDLQQTLAHLREVEQAYVRHVRGEQSADLEALDLKISVAIDSLRALRKEAPRDVPLGQHIRAANQLRFSLHQARKL